MSETFYEVANKYEELYNIDYSLIDIKAYMKMYAWKYISQKLEFRLLDLCINGFVAYLRLANINNSNKEDVTNYFRKILFNKFLEETDIVDYLHKNDFSKEHILESVDKSLKRLNMDYIDVLLLHRPDTLMEPEEVAEAFNILEKEGKVRYFGVSNQNSMQMELLQRYCSQKLIINQLQFSVAHCDIIDSGLNVNVHNDAGCVRDGSILEYCRLKEVTIQAWSPFQYGFFEGVFIGSEKFPELNKMLDELAEKYHVTSSAIAIAWILRHPAGIQAILGSTKKQRIAEICKASEIKLTREEWYALYMAAGKKLP